MINFLQNNYQETITSLTTSLVVVFGVVKFVGQKWLEKQFELLRHKDVVKHNEKLITYKDAINLICEVLRELEYVAKGKTFIFSKSS
jgi:hypothetical protein